MAAAGHFGARAGVVSALVSCARSLGNLLVDALIASGLVRHRTTVMLGAMPVLSLTAIALGRSTSFAQARAGPLAPPPIFSSRLELALMRHVGVAQCVGSWA
jgi:hypothetical protein